MKNLICFFCIVLAGCQAVPNVQRLEGNLPQNFKSSRTVEETWQAICAEVTNNPNCRVLVRKPTAHLISWAEPAENWRDLSQDAIDHISPFASADNLKNMAREGAKGIAVTVIWIDKAVSGCKVNIRRVYYGTKTLSGVAHSRGDYEYDFAAKIQLGWDNSQLEKREVRQ